MNSPAAALAWEVWRRHRARLLAISIVLSAFALFYPAVCALMGLDLDGPDALVATLAASSRWAADGHPSVNIFRVVSLLFLLMGPLACMAMSLLCVIWVFGLVQADAKRGFSFPARLFTLPISTPFLAFWAMAVGALVVGAVYVGWTRLVHLPHIEVFAGYSNGLLWLALLMVSLAVLWGLDAFPVTRLLALTATIWVIGYLGGPGLHGFPLLERHQSAVLWVLVFTGCGAAYIGLRQIRRGAWQGWSWKLRLAPTLAALRRRTPDAFRSPVRAQLWFEWRLQGRKAFAVCAVAALPVLGLVVVRTLARLGPIDPDDIFRLGLYLLALPLFVHFIQGINPERQSAPFVLTRPLTSGGIVVAKLGSAALSTVLSWAVTLPLLALLPLLGDVPDVLDNLVFLARGHPLKDHPGVPAVLGQAAFLAQNHSLAWFLLPVLLLGLMVLTWRFVAAELWFGLCGSSRLAVLPTIKFYGLLVLFGVLTWRVNEPGAQARLLGSLPFLLAFLVLLKFSLAQWAFRVSLRRELLTRDWVRRYLLVWLALAFAFVVPTVLVFHRETWGLSAALGLILLLPLARIGFSPISLSLGRHR